MKSFRELIPFHVLRLTFHALFLAGIVIKPLVHDLALLPRNVVRENQSWLMPPSATNSVPTIYAESADERYSTAHRGARLSRLHAVGILGNCVPYELPTMIYVSNYVFLQLRAT